MKENDVKIAHFVTAGSGLQMAENLIPYPVPGLRIGFANVLTLHAVNNLGFRGALAVAVLRPAAAAVAGGWFATPVFVFSFLGSVASFLMMSLFKRIFGKLLSNIGISVAGSLSHISAQLCLFSLFTPPEAILFMLPALLSVSILSGIITGYLLNRVEKTGFIPDKNGLKVIDTDKIPELGFQVLMPKTIFKIIAGIFFVTLLLMSSNLLYAVYIVLSAFAAAVILNFSGVKKSALSVLPMVVAMLLVILFGGKYSPVPLLNLISLIYFCIAVSDRKNNYEFVTVLFSLALPAEKIGVPVKRLYSILMVCLESNWPGMVKNAVARLTNPATK